MRTSFTRILFWSELFWPYIGGAEIFASQLISALQPRGYEFMVVTSHDYLDLPDDAHYRGIPVYRLPFRNAVRSGDLDQFLDVCQEVKRLKQSFKPDLVHVNAIFPSVLFHLRTVAAHAAPTLVRISHEIVPGKDAGLNTLTGRVLRAADWVCCASSTLLEQVSRLAPEVRARSCVIYNGSEVRPILAEVRPAEASLLLCLGRLAPVKGFDLVLTALASIIDYYPNVRLVIAGDGVSRTDLERQSAALGLKKAVEFVGWVEPDKVRILINSASMVLMPSWSEGLPNVALQAAMMARPVVATRAGGLAEVVIHQQTGLSIEKGDSQGLAQAIKFLLDNPEAAREMGRAARERAQEHFSWPACVNAYDNLYRKLIEASADRDPQPFLSEQSVDTQN